VEAEEVAPKPADSKARLETKPNKVELIIPPQGLWKGKGLAGIGFCLFMAFITALFIYLRKHGQHPPLLDGRLIAVGWIFGLGSLVAYSKGLIRFGIGWCLFTTFLTALFIVIKHSAPDLPLFVWGIIAAMWLAGLITLVAGINMGVRRATISAGGDGLRVEQKGLFGAKRREWQRGEIAAVHIGPSGTSINNVPIMELQIYAVASKKKVGLLAGRPGAELRWLACELRRALDVPAQRPGEGKKMEAKR
jgi:hypothetical protein